MKTTIRKFVKMWEDGTHDDIDVYDNVCEELGIAYCGGYKLTKEGEKQFAEVLDYSIEIVEPVTKYDYPIAIVDVDGDEGIWQKKLKKAKEFFYSVAGYCADSDFNKWFIECE